MNKLRNWSKLPQPEQGFCERTHLRDVEALKDRREPLSHSQALIKVREALVAELLSGPCGQQFLCVTARHQVKVLECVQAVWEALLLDDLAPTGDGFTLDPGQQAAFTQAFPRQSLASSRAFDGLQNLRRWIWISLMIGHYQSRGL